MPPYLVRSIPADQTPLTGSEIIMQFSERLDPLSVAGAIRAFPPSNKFKTRVKSNQIIIQFIQKPDSMIYINLSEKIADLRHNTLINAIMLAYGDSSQIPHSKIHGFLTPLCKLSDNTPLKVALLKPVTSGKQIKDSMVWINRWNLSTNSFIFNYLTVNQSYTLITFIDTNSNNLPDPDEDYSIYPKSIQPDQAPIQITMISRSKPAQLQRLIQESPQILQLSFSHAISQLNTGSFSHVIDQNRAFVFLDNLSNPADTIPLKFSGLDHYQTSFTIDTTYIKSPDTTFAHPRLINPLPPSIYTGDTLHFVFNYNVSEHSQDLVTFEVDHDTIRPEINLKNPFYIQCPINLETNKFSVILRLSLLDTVVQDIRQEITLIAAKSLCLLSGNVNRVTPEDMALGLISLADYTPIYYPGQWIKSAFRWPAIPPGHYLIFTFLDHNQNRIFNCGSLTQDSIEVGEPYWLYPDTLNLRSYWEIEGIQLQLPE